MAKKKDDDSATISLDDFTANLAKDWKGKFLSAAELKDDNLKSISTNSVKLDWALGKLLEGSMIEIYGENSCGKAQPLDSNILTPNGFIKMKNVTIGTKVCTPNGGIADVIGIYPQGLKDIYRITFSDGTVAESCEDHLWYTETLADRSKKRNGSVKTLKEIMKKIKRVGKNNSISNNHALPLIKPASFNKKELPIDPYLLGCLLGDGSLSIKSNILLTTTDNEIANECLLKSNSLNATIKKVTNSLSYRIIRKNRKIPSTIKKELDKLKLLGTYSHNKFIPDIYKTSSIQDRILLLQGLLDTDGTVDKVGGRITYTTTSKQLLEDTIFIARSLGAKVSSNSRITSYKSNGEIKKGRMSYNAFIRFGKDFNPFFLNRKLSLFKKTNYNPIKTIDSVEYVGKKEAQCILINSKEHLYITDDFNITHNTTLALEIGSNAAKMNKMVYYLDLERKLRQAQIDMIRDLDKTKLSVMYPDTAEEALDMMEEVVRNVPGCVIILDSVSGLLPEVEDAEDASKLTIGTVAKFCAKIVRKLTGLAAKNKCTLIFLNHKTCYFNPL